MSASIKNKLAGKTSKLSQKKEMIADHPAAINNYQNGSFYLVDIEQIKPDPNQPRQYFDETALNELTESIKQKGVLQPVIIRKDSEDTIWLVAGERRWRAAKLAGLEKVPAIITTGNPAEISLIENIQRENLKPIEEAEAYARMIQEFGYTQEKLAEVIGKAKSTVSETMSLNKLPEDLKEQVRRAEHPKRLLLEVSKQETHEAMRTLFEKIQSNNLKSDEVRDISREPRERIRRTPAAITLDKILNLSKTLNTFDMKTANESEKIQLLQELQALKNKLEKILN
jgi:ParB family transcriptional regulator, chromosome partitioning protein